MKSLYDAENIYFLVEWADPTESLELQPWVKQSDGSWKQSRNPDSTGSENTYSEDKLGLMWNVNGKDFETRGCSADCHKSRNGKLNGVDEKLPARKYTNNPGEVADFWAWRAVSTNPVGQMEDGYIDDNKDPKNNPNWGRHVDDSTGGGTVPNEANSKPAFMNAAPGGPKYYVLGNAKVPFVDNFKAGDIVGSVVVAPATGSRGDIEAKGVWKAGKWTVEIKRKRAAANPKQDVQFTDAKKAYAFGVSVFDNTSINHLFVEGVQKLTLK
jgi:ethylbenzene dehydrogenase